MIRHWLRRLKMTSQASRVGSRGRYGRRLPGLEGMEDRILLSGPTAYTVDSIGDTGTGSGDSGDLRYVINKANLNPNTAGSLIQFDPAKFAQIADITLSSTLELAKTAGPVVIDGPDLHATLGIESPGSPSIIAIDGNFAFGDFMVDSGVTATLSGLDIENGSAAGDGGGIDNQGTLTITGCIISNNSAAGNGGGISNSFMLTVTDSLLLYNSSDNLGGGISNSGSLAVTSSFIEDNTASNDGGGIAAGGLLKIANDTIIGNTASNGGGIANIGKLTAVNVTITGNEVGGSGVGGGIDTAGIAALDNTIVALNTVDGTTASDINGPVSSDSSFNLIGTGGSGGLTGFDNGNQVGVADPGVGQPTYFGGFSVFFGATLIPLLPGSPAIDAGNNALAVDPATGQPLTNDQRGAGFERIFNGTVDIGAYELQPSTVEDVSVSWGASGTSALQTAADGLRLLPAGRNTDMPWLGIDQIQISLNQPATLTAADVSVQGIRGINYGPVTTSGFRMEYTITLAQPIEAADRVTITIGGASFFSYARRLDVLPGDFNDDGAVNRKDVSGVRGEVKGTGGAKPTVFGNILGDGSVDARDLKAEKKLVGKGFPKPGGKSPRSSPARALVRQHPGAKLLFEHPGYHPGAGLQTSPTRGTARP